MQRSFVLLLCCASCSFYVLSIADREPFAYDQQFSHSTDENDARTTVGRRPLSTIHIDVLSETPVEASLVRDGERILLQSEGFDAASEPERECSLRRVDIRRYLDESSRTWTIDDDVLDAIDSDVQSLVDCTNEGDALLFDSTKIIRPSARVVLPWPLTLSAFVEHAELEEGVFPKALKKATFTCPHENEGIFLVRTGGSTLANLAFEGCTFGESEEEKAMIEVDGCASARADRTLLLHNLSFKENRLVDATGVWVHSTSCLALDMRSVEFSDNQCSSSGCGAILSSGNSIEDFTARRNRLTEEHDRQPSVLNAPAGSRTAASGIRAVHNDLSAMHVVEGSLTLTDSTCSHNSVEAFDDEEPFGPCIHLVRSTATIQESRFEGNEGYWGGSVSMWSSNISLSDSDFQSNRAEKGGVLYAERGSTVSIERCRFTENRASEHGGVGFIESSSLSMSDSAMSGNSATDGGGSLRLTDSELAIEACHFQNGSASFGGFIHVRRTLVNVSDSEFARGTATQGGCIALDKGSRFVSQNDVFKSSSARRNGGVVDAQRNSSLSFINATFVSNTAAMDGSCIFAEASHVFTKQSLATNNTGLGDGAFLSAANRSSAEIVDTTFLGNSADFGGVVSLRTMSSVEVHGSLFSGNAAVGGGGSFYSDSDCTLSVHLCRFNNGTAGNGGGFVSSSDSEIRIVSSYFANASAVLGGCFAVSTGARMTVENSTVAFCSGQNDGGAIHSYTSTVVVRNSIVANSTSDRGAGGGISCVQMSRISAVNSSFEANSCIYGGAISLMDKSVATVAGCRFSGNTVQRTGASLYVDASNATLSHCIFTNGNASDGGALSVHRSARASLTDSSISYGMSSRSGGGITVGSESVLEMRNVSMENNTSLNSGGAIYVEDSSTVHVRNSSFVRNQAMAFGGAIVAITGSELIGDALVFDENSAREKDGGSIGSLEAHRLQISNSRFSRGMANNGGGLVIRHNTGASVFVNCSFESTSALSVGGACVVTSSVAKFENCSMVGNRAGRVGGSLAVTNATVDIHNCHFSGNNGTHSGGFVGATNSEIRGRNVSMVDASSEYGGAMWLYDSAIQLEDAHFSRCHAITSGGAVFGSENSSFRCTSCVFEDNAGLGWGGALCFIGVMSHPVSVQIDGSTFENNVATHGGAIAFLRDSDQANCAIQDDTCSFLVVTDSVFSENMAEIVGGAIFVSDIDSIRMSCSANENWQSRSEFYDRTELEALDVLRSADDICQSWKGNQAGAYGDDVGSAGAGVRITVIPDNLHNPVEEVSGNRLVVEEHSSGKPLPAIHMEVVDGLSQGPAFGLERPIVEAVMTSPDNFFTGSIKIEIEEGVGNFSGAVGFGPEGVYECIIDFSERLIESLVVEVHVRGCRLGEVAAANGTVCEPCTSDTYNLQPGNDGTGCHPCPENGDCATHVILSAKGYWHKTPCSENIQECISSEACSSEEREDKLTAATRNISSCEFDEEFKQNYTEAQCREGHEGPLCGSCKASYGKSHSSLCEECFSGFGNYALIFMSFLVLLALSYITVRSNTISTPTSGGNSVESIRQLRSLPSRSISVPVNEEMVEMIVTGRVPPEILQPELYSAQVSETPSEDADLAKWKTVEMFKIMVNFLQVTAVAIAINVKWTLMLIALFEGAEFISGMTSQAVNRSADCVVPDDASVDRSIASVIIDICLPLGAICVFSVIWLAVKVKRGEPWTHLLKKIILTTIAVLYISYISLTKTFVGILDCVEVYDSIDSEFDVTSNYWSTDTKIECYKGPHALLAFLLAWPLLILFSFGFPLITACVIVKNVEEDYERGWIYETCGFLYRSYKKNYVFWESVIMLRKAVLAVIVVFSYPLGANLQQVLAGLLFTFVLYLQMLCCPYRPEFDSLNKMESLSILVSAMTFGSSMFFGDEHVSSNVRIVITVGIAFFNIALFVFFFVVFVIYAANYLRTVLDEEGVPYKPDGGAHHILWVCFYHYLVERLRKAILKLLCGARPTPA